MRSSNSKYPYLIFFELKLNTFRYTNMYKLISLNSSTPNIYKALKDTFMHHPQKALSSRPNGYIFEPQSIWQTKSQYTHELAAQVSLLECNTLYDFTDPLKQTPIWEKTFFQTDTVSILYIDNKDKVIGFCLGEIDQDRIKLITIGSMSALNPSKYKEWQIGYQLMDSLILYSQTKNIKVISATPLLAANSFYLKYCDRIGAPKPSEDKNGKVFIEINLRKIKI